MPAEHLEPAGASMAPIDDTLLVRAAAGGDRSAFESLYRRHGGRVFAACRRLSGSTEIAEELTQETFIRAWKALSGFAGEASFATWIHRIAVNLSLDHRRAGGRRAEVGFDEVAVIPHARGSQPGSALDLEAAIAALPSGSRRVFVLHDVEGYRHREIAELTGLAVGTCKAHLHRARRLLREVLS